VDGYKFEFSPKFALTNSKRIRQMAVQVRLLSQMCLVELLTQSLGGGTVLATLGHLEAPKHLLGVEGDVPYSSAVSDEDLTSIATQT